MTEITIAHLLAILAVVVVVPLGCQVVGRPPLGRAAAAARVLAAGSLLLPTGPVPVLLALPWLLAAGATALSELMRWSRQPMTLAAGARLIAFGWLAVASGFLVVDRTGWSVLGYSPETVAFTVAHFLDAGFGLAVLTALLVHRIGHGPLATLVGALTLGGPFVVALGFMTTPSVNLAGTTMVAGGVILLSLTTLGSVLPGIRSRRARALLGISSYAWIVSMPLAVVYALASAAVQTLGFAAPSHTVMAALHGSINGIGFVLCGLLGWREVRGARGDTLLPYGSEVALHADVQAP